MPFPYIFNTMMELLLDANSRVVIQRQQAFRFAVYAPSCPLCAVPVWTCKTGIQRNLEYLASEFILQKIRKGVIMFGHIFLITPGLVIAIAARTLSISFRDNIPFSNAASLIVLPVATASFATLAASS